MIHIPFNQNDIILKLDYKKNNNLFKINKNLGGLCELICNRILIDDLLGKENDLDTLKKRITIEKIDVNEIKTSHPLNIFSIFTIFIYYLIRTCPDNILSCFEQWRLINDKCVNRKVLENGLRNVKDGKTLKVGIFSRKFLSSIGHSLLIKKISDNHFIFFDPNEGEYRGLNFSELSCRIDKAFKQINGTDLFITQGEVYLKRIKKNQPHTFLMSYLLR